MPVDVDRDHQLTTPHHDGTLHAVECWGEGELVLRYACASGQPYRLTLTGVRAADVSGFRCGNIILSLMLLPASAAESRLSAAQLSRLGHGRPAALRGRFVFLLDSSYGAEVVVDRDDACVEEDGGADSASQPR